MLLFDREIETGRTMLGLRRSSSILQHGLKRVPSLRTIGRRTHTVSPDGGKVTGADT
jgi:hypothetical protein